MEKDQNLGADAAAVDGAGSSDSNQLPHADECGSHWCGNCEQDTRRPDWCGNHPSTLAAECAEFEECCCDCDALKPCPFCGARAEIIEVEETDNAGGFVVCCTGCEASTKVWFPIKDDVRRILRDEWNRRVETGNQAAPPALGSLRSEAQKS